MLPIDDELASIKWSISHAIMEQKRPAAALRTLAPQTEARKASWCRIAAGCHLGRRQTLPF